MSHTLGWPLDCVSGNMWLVWDIKSSSFTGNRKPKARGFFRPWPTANVFEKKPGIKFRNDCAVKRRIEKFSLPSPCHSFTAKMMRVHLILCTLAVAVQVAVTNSATNPCYSNTEQCLSDLRSLLVDTNKFWFGSSYAKSCPDGPTSSPACGNPDTDKKSILSRLLGLNDTLDQATLNQTAQNITLANITFTAPAGNYTGCGQEYQVPALNNYLVDPLEITRVSSWSLIQTPKVTWNPVTQNTPQILAIWDPGNYYNHGLYVNCVNGSLDSCKAVRPYFGPLNTHLRANTYIFAVYQQAGMINITAARDFIEGQALLEPAKFVAKFTSMSNNSPVHAGVMTIVADPYSVQKIYDRFFMVNNCPYLVSQLDTFRALVTATGLPMPWSDNSTLSLYRNSSFLTSLTTNIDVRFWADDLNFESCCTNYSTLSGSFIVNPFNERTVRPVNVRNKPQVQLTPMGLGSMGGIAGDSYTLFMVDVFPALAPGAANVTFVAHWLVTNIQNADINTGDQVAQYFGPNPFFASEHHPYMFLLMKQPEARINNTIYSTFCPGGTTTCMIDLKKVLDAWNLTEIVGLTWFLSEQDAFARYRMYDVLKAVPKATVCQGLPGYANPCPSPCPSNSNKNNNSNNGVLHRMKGTVLVLVLAFVSYFVRII